MDLLALYLSLILHLQNFENNAITRAISTPEVVVLEDESEYEESNYIENEEDAVLERWEVNTDNFEYEGELYDGKWRYTYYSQNVLPGLSVPGKYVDEQGIIRDKDGYAVVASVDEDYGTIIEDTAFGAAKVYDTGEFESGTLDVYTDF